MTTEQAAELVSAVQTLHLVVAGGGGVGFCDCG
jgi:hypothetical protein